MVSTFSSFSAGFSGSSGFSADSAASASRLRVLSDFHSHLQLNVLPTLALCVPVFLIFLSSAFFLEAYVLEKTTAHLAVFGIGAYIVFSTYFVANFYMQKLSSSYHSIPDDKKFYVLSNLIKSAVLLAYCPSAASTLWRAIQHDDWSTPRIRNLGVLYAIPDAVSLLLVSRMATSTRVHHLCVVLFMLVNLLVTYEDETVGRALVVYAVFSTFAYLVNLLLASRFLPVTPWTSLTLSVLALLIYTACLGINWAWQVAFLARLVRARPTLPTIVSVVLYVLPILMVVRDDVVLVKWLWKNCGKTWQAVKDRIPGSPMKKRRSD